eukprot:13102636-Alexandrium_andersonii.AAC.1
MGDSRASNRNRTRANSERTLTNAGMFAEPAWDIPHSGGAKNATHGSLRCDVTTQLNNAA